MFEASQLARLIALVDAAVDSTAKGLSFETLASYVFEHLDGVEIAKKNARMESEEIDIVLWNAQLEPVLRPWEAVILVECKNWSQSVGAQALDAFIGKLRRRSLKTGIFVAACGVTGQFVSGNGDEAGATGLIRSALQEGIRVIVVTLGDIRAITSLDDIRELIKKRYCGLYVHKVF